MSCTFCSEAALVSIDGLEVGASCARRIGRLALAGTPDVWPSAGASPSDAAPKSDPAFTTMLRAFQRGVAERIAPHDAESHYHLAHAYRAMGLHEDAVRAAGTALDVDPSPIEAPSREAVEHPLRLLLTPPLLKKNGGLAALRLRLGVV